MLPYKNWLFGTYGIVLTLSMLQMYRLLDCWEIEVTPESKAKLSWVQFLHCREFQTSLDLQWVFFSMDYNLLNHIMNSVASCFLGYENLSNN